MCVCAETSRRRPPTTRRLSKKAALAVLSLALAPAYAEAAREERQTFADIDALLASPLQSGPVRVRGCLFYTTVLGPHLYSDCDALSVDVPVSVSLDFRKALPAIIRWRKRAFACIEFEGEWTRYPAPKVVGWTRDHGEIQATFAMRKVEGCAPLVAPAGLDAGIAAADMAVRFASPEEAAIAIDDVSGHVAAMPKTPGPRMSMRSRAAVQRWQASSLEPVASAADRLTRLLPAAAAERIHASPEQAAPESE